MTTAPTWPPPPPQTDPRVYVAYVVVIGIFAGIVTILALGGLR